MEQSDDVTRTCDSDPDNNVDWYDDAPVPPEYLAELEADRASPEPRADRFRDFKRDFRRSRSLTSTTWRQMRARRERQRSVGNRRSARARSPRPPRADALSQPTTYALDPEPPAQFSTKMSHGERRRLASLIADVLLADVFCRVKVLKDDNSD
jgi:hypothetical protein